MTAATSTMTDEQIRRKVLDEVKWDARLHPNEVAVAVKDDVVTLTGVVDSYVKKRAAEQAAAERAAWSPPGVNAVENRIVVKP